MQKDHYTKEYCVEVAVSLPVSQTFIYKLPEHLIKSEITGLRILVPFGRRRVTGYILGTQDDNQGYQPKLVLDILDDIPLFHSLMVPFFRWIARYYIHPIGEVIRTALPSGLDSHDVSLVTIKEQGKKYLQNDSDNLILQNNNSIFKSLEHLTPSEKYVIKQLSNAGGTLPLKTFTKETNVEKTNVNKTEVNKTDIEKTDIISNKAQITDNLSKSNKKTQSRVSYALIKKMAEKELIEITSELKKDQTRIKLEKFISISLSLADTDVVNSDVFMKLSRKRQEIIQTVRKHNEISMSALKKEIPTAPKLVQLMAEDGLLNIAEKQVFRDPFGDTVDPDVPPELTSEQSLVVNQVSDKMDLGFQRYLLSGVTGSGKTEVYMRLVTEAVKRGKGAIILVPEISLISQTERRFRARFGNTVAILHSALSKGEVIDQWHRIAKGEVIVVIGARSAIFAPVENLGIIIVDEEHDTSYKQETGLRYNARDLAVVRAQQHNITVILGSATPSVQSYYNACQGKFEELVLKTRVNNNPLPEITLVDLKKYKDCGWKEKLITPELSKAISGCLSKGEQVLIFLNRRGFSTYPVCESCGEAVKCKFCDIAMTLHKDNSEFKCHLCGFTVSSTITTHKVEKYQANTNMPWNIRVSSSVKCSKCGSIKIKPLGFGTERIETLLKSMFPDARIIRLDQDTGGKKGATVQILKKVKNRTVDIIVGTQMLAKGHDFPAITLVGVICADLSLNFPDFRSGERTFQLLAQVAGRAGRGEKPGKVIMQTYNPDHFSIESSKNQDFVEFYNHEIPFRKALSYPPFSRIIQLKISGTDMEKVKSHALIVGEKCQSFIDALSKTNSEQIQMLGPIEAGIPKISMRYRWQILLKSPSANMLKSIIHNLMSDSKTFDVKDVSVGIDVDPYFMM